MQKLKLDLETISVASFPTTVDAEAVLRAAPRAMVTNTICGPTCRGTSVCCETA
jgi:hypothetical protein